MTAYFKPLRRKIGVLTLVIACVFAAGWVRSLRVRDSCVMSHGKYQKEMRYGIGILSLTSNNGSIAAQIGEERSRDPGIIDQIESDYRCPRWESFIDEDLSDVRPYLICRFEFCGFEFYQMTESDSGMVNLIFVPYWSIVFPLTVVSAWLLLSKPRVAAPKPSAEPIPTDRA